VKTNLAKLALAAVLLAVAAAAWPQQDRVVRVQEDQVARWNQFVADLYALHEKRLAEHEVREESRVGGYQRQPDYYEEITYVDKASGLPLSRIRWIRGSKAADPVDRVHTIAVYFHDGRGRVEREYAAAYLTEHRNAPVQTLVFFHKYDRGVHGFRSFDANGVRILEKCSGTLAGKDVSILLDGDDGSLDHALDDPGGIIATPEYKACFAGLPEDASAYLPPR
jgi:hypothetical protein